MTLVFHSAVGCWWRTVTKQFGDDSLHWAREKTAGVPLGNRTKLQLFGWYIFTRG